MSNLYAPTLTYPNGGESIMTSTATISWNVPQVLDDSDRPTWIEVYYCDHYKAGEDPNWTAIATVPSTVTQFVWKISRNLISSTMRIGIRTRNSIGARSAYSISAANFSVNRASLSVPQIISPVPNGRYDTSISVMIAPETLPDRSYYAFYYSSQSLGTPVTSIGRAIPVNALPFVWLTAELPAAKDYTFYAAIVDKDGNTSEKGAVSGISISHEGYFLIDTQPPEATIKIAGNSQFTKNKNIGVTIYGYDEATGVQSMQINDVTVGATDTSQNGHSVPLLPKASTVYTLHGNDGLKNVELLVQDFGGNRNSDFGVQRVFLDAFRVAGLTVEGMCSAILNTTNVVYVVTSGDENALYVLSPFPTRITTLSQVPTAVGVFQNQVYVATIDDSRVGHVQVSVLGGLNTVYDFTTTDQYVTDMVTYNDLLFWGTSDGRLMSYDGTVVTSLGLVNGSRAVESLGTDGSAIYITTENSTAVFMYNGGTFIQIMS